MIKSKFRFCHFCEKKKHFKDFRFAAMNYGSRSYICRACEIFVPPDYPVNKGGVYLLLTPKLVIPGRSMNLKARFATYRGHGCDIEDYVVWPSEINQNVLEKKLVDLCACKLELHAGKEVFKGTSDKYEEIIQEYTSLTGLEPERNRQY